MCTWFTRRAKGHFRFQSEKITRKWLVEPRPALLAVHLFHISTIPGLGDYSIEETWRSGPSI